MPAFDFANQFFAQYNAARSHRLQAQELARRVRADRARAVREARLDDLRERAQTLLEKESDRKKAADLVKSITEARQFMTFLRAGEQQKVTNRQRDAQLDIGRRDIALREGEFREKQKGGKGIDTKELFLGTTDKQLEAEAKALTGKAGGKVTVDDSERAALMRRELARREEERNREFEGLISLPTLGTVGNVTPFGGDKPKKRKKRSVSDKLNDLGIQ